MVLVVGGWLVGSTEAARVAADQSWKAPFVEEARVIAQQQVRWILVSPMVSSVLCRHMSSLFLSARVPCCLFVCVYGCVWVWGVGMGVSEMADVCCVLAPDFSRFLFSFALQALWPNHTKKHFLQTFAQTVHRQF